MATYFGIDEKLLEAVQKIGGHKTKQAAINTALKEYIERHRQSRIIELFGQIEYDPEYDYKKQRSLQ